MRTLVINESAPAYQPVHNETPLPLPSTLKGPVTTNQKACGCECSGNQPTKNAADVGEETPLKLPKMNF